ncbi:hypothetical protein HPP92_028613 [Vanilla planifolia]|uniref:Uncharacterized protein n=1 Tax=Vanilla planifolia TaxID=51239 RepID=A0A835U2D0_VANPL|nr:hypothetical protein HPP92_028613 [Vanilla planifolia]KAG0446934.1 hypothetical protein HPP92_028607 [Vanilla planifolia]
MDAVDADEYGAMNSFVQRQRPPYICCGLQVCDGAQAKLSAWPFHDHADAFIGTACAGVRRSPLRWRGGVKRTRCMRDFDAHAAGLIACFTVMPERQEVGGRLRAGQEVGKQAEQLRGVSKLLGSPARAALRRTTADQPARCGSRYASLKVDGSKTAEVMAGEVNAMDYKEGRVEFRHYAKRQWIEILLRQKQVHCANGNGFSEEEAEGGGFSPEVCLGDRASACQPGRAVDGTSAGKTLGSRSQSHVGSGSIGTQVKNSATSQLQTYGMESLVGTLKDSSIHKIWWVTSRYASTVLYTQCLGPEIWMCSRLQQAFRLDLCRLPSSSKENLTLNMQIFDLHSDNEIPSMDLAYLWTGWRTMTGSSGADEAVELFIDERYGTVRR